jgi:hypothetical protein
MARKPASRAEFTLFDVVYEGGSQRSSRRVPSEVLGGLQLTKASCRERTQQRTQRGRSSHAF